ncbi:MAG: hypothetical protein ACXV8K_19645, partial [Ilumatobacteraceae bacterium]
MADEPKTTPEGVPDAVLEELLAAFSAKEAGTIDFDDPSIDRILGIGDAAMPHTGVAENRVADVSEKSESSAVWKP